MRTVVFAFVTLIAGCGDNIRPGLFVDTQVASNTLAAGDPVGARCRIVDEHGDAAQESHGNTLADETELVVGYEAPDSFATDASGQVVAAKVGTANVRCSAPSLALVDQAPEQVTIVAGPPVRVITRRDHPTTLAVVIVPAPLGDTATACVMLGTGLSYASNARLWTPSGSPASVVG